MTASLSYRNKSRATGQGCGDLRRSGKKNTLQTLGVPVGFQHGN